MRNLLLRSAVLAFVLLAALPVTAQVGFGSSTATSGDLVFVGEPGNLIEPGIVYVYRADGGAWTETRQLRASDGMDADGFGRSIALEVATGVALVGADAADAAYVFSLDDMHQMAKLSVSGLSGAKFGSAVAIDGDLAVVGAPASDGGRGAAYVFARNGDAWDLVTMISGDGNEEAAEGEEEGLAEAFGASVAVTGDWILVGAPGGTVDMFLQAMFRRGAPSGAIYAFRRDGANVERADKLVPPFGGDNSTFGFSLNAADGLAVAGAPTTDQFSGAAHVFALVDDEWTWASRLMPFDSRPGGMFGAAVALGSDEVYVGAPGAGTGRNEGRIYTFSKSARGEWSGASKLGASGLKWGSIYGTAVAASADSVVAGMPGEDYGAGAAVVMTRLL
ncbi:MAG: hypothetical protein GKS06_17300 [Acidobacteria bacterium]|nr:hypothetical protein [Acidobacteriota bacterium]